MSIEQIQQIIDNGGECPTRGGVEARVFMIAEGRTFPVMGAVKSVDGWVSRSWHLDGGCNRTANSPYDLILPSAVAYERWVNQYPGGVASMMSLAEASLHKALGCLATHKYTYYTDGSTPDVETVWRRGDE